ncbi:Crp/Fnr family transcriptional regulator [Actinomadura rubrisoli]|uniref:Cyclic nucleotide-binding domain-containing protein n=1 Tax=Actinomadura rubrisoli TaxID=2530368 RepID=A0A4R5C9N6_9ACTN|nr:cyclic nucleotide-binding domain-containing protein [Actinomadura rubrisoli]TDD95376.1 cyclic nucleotide-binding domain-containing protein [Actinomadura rubrisoli]
MEQIFEGSFFATFPGREREVILSSARKCEFQPREPLTCTGRFPEAVIVIVHGWAAADVPIARMATYGPGDCVGVEAVATQNLSMSTIYALTTVHGLSIDSAKFLEVLERLPQVRELIALQLEHGYLTTPPRTSTSSRTHFSSTTGPADSTQFIDLLKAYHLACGQPSYRTLAQLSYRQRHGNLHLAPLSPTTVSNVLSGRRRNKIPRWEWVASFVISCLTYAQQCALKTSSESEELQQWRSLYATARKEQSTVRRDSQLGSSSS